LADFTSTVEIVFGVIDNASQEITSLGNATSGFATNVASATQPLADFTKNLLAVEAAVAATAAAALGFAINEAVQVESAFADLGKVAGLSATEVADVFGPDINTAADQYGVSLQGVTDQLTQFIQAGFTAEESTTLLDTALKAAVITELSAAQAAQLLVQTLRGFGLPASEAAGALDTLNAISNTFATTAGSLGDAVARLSPVAAQLGLDFNQTAAILTPVLEIFQDGESSARGLQVAFLNLATVATKQINAELERLGVVFKDTQTGALLPGADILANLAVKFQDLTKEQQLTTAEIIAGASQAGRLTAALQAMGGTFFEVEQFSSLFTETSREQAEVMATLGVDISKLGTEAFNAEGGLKQLRDGFNALDPAAQATAASILAGSGNADALTAALAGTDRATAAYLTSLLSAESAQNEFNVRSQTTEFLLNRLSTSFGVLLNAVGSELLGGFGDAVDGLRVFTTALTEAVDTDTVQAALAFVNARFFDFGIFIEGLASNIPAAFEGVDFTPLLDALSRVTGGIGGLFDGLDLNTADGLTEALQGIVDLSADLIDATRGIFQVFAQVGGVILDLVNAYTSLDTETQELIGQFLGIATVVNTVALAVAPLALAVGGLGPIFSGITSVASGVSGALSTIGAAFTAVSAGGAAAAAGAAAAGVGLGFLLNEIPAVRAATEALNNALGPGADSLGTWAFELINGGNSADEFGQKIDGVPIADFVAALRAGKVSITEFAEKTGLSVEFADNLKTSVKETAEAANSFSDEMSELNEVTDEQNINLEKIAETLSGLGIKYEVVNGAIKKATDQQDEFGDELAENAELFRRQDESLAEYARRLKEAGFASKDVTDETRAIKDSQGELIEVTTKVVDGVVEFSGNQRKLAEDTKKAKDEIDKETEAADKLKIKLEEIASNERIAAIEARVEINIAEIEADTERLNIAFESVNNTVNSTADVIDSVFGALGQVGGFYALEQLEIIEKQLKIENERRERALELQAELTRAQIENIEARTEALGNGEALIKIEGDGLEPELEAFMFQILKKIQLKASAEGAEFLLGITA
jgi:TP901 family phage tail tape measure protein